MTQKDSKYQEKKEEEVSPTMSIENNLSKQGLENYIKKRKEILIRAANDGISNRNRQKKATKTRKKK